MVRRNFIGLLGLLLMFLGSVALSNMLSHSWMGLVWFECAAAGGMLLGYSLKPTADQEQKGTK
jgi:hypothetical protein